VYNNEVEGPGCRCKVKSERPGGPTHRIYYATHGYASGCCVSPPGLMNANLCGSICLYCISGHVWPLQPSSLTRGRPPQPPRPLFPRPKPRWRRGAKRLDGADVRCEGSSRIFCKIHYRAFASPTAPKNGIGRCTLTRNPQWSRPTHA
jgi:hypothetical protein